MWYLAFRQTDTNISEKGVVSFAQRIAASHRLENINLFSVAGNHWFAHLVYMAEGYGN
jgi:hypothetical protein